MKHKALFIGVLALGFGLFTLWRFSADAVLEAENFEKLGEAVSSEDLNPVSAASAQKLVFVFGGDVMLGRKVNYEVKQGGDYSLPFQDVASVWQDADAVLVNLESPLAEDCPVRNDKTMTFCGETKFAPILRSAGINFISFANNHYLDYGQKGWQETNEYLAQAGISVINHGEELVVEIKGKKIGFLSWNLTWNSVSNEDLMFAIRSLRPRVDFLAVNYHWGDEYQDYPNDYQKNVAHLSVDNGADLVIGHHPHHVQPVEEYPSATLGASRNSLIFYSLGNLVFDQMWSEKTRQGMLAKVEWRPDARRISYQIFNTQIDNWVEVKIVE